MLDLGVLCEPRGPIPEIICRYSPLVEVGGGDGRWVTALRKAGATIESIDIAPRSELVAQGSHLDAAAMHGDRTLLAVWPPDGVQLQVWRDAGA